MLNGMIETDVLVRPAPRDEQALQLGRAGEPVRVRNYRPPLEPV